MNSRQVLTIVLAGVFLLGACDQEARMASTGFRLPDGDPQAGREAFIYMQCHQCHTIKGMELPIIPGQEPPYVELGGTVTAVKTYGQLITAVIYPSHKLAAGYAEEVVSEDGVSNMYVYNEHMTVQELIDIVMFLQPQYDVVIPEVTYRR
jgi:mono/diheme cytochrome c family protein